MIKAEKKDWKTCPMPEETDFFQMEIGLTSQEFEMVQHGLIPEEMEDKWFIYFEDGVLSMHRSWTGFCIYKIRFSEDLRTVCVTVNRQEAQYPEKNVEQDKRMVSILINRLAKRPGNAELMKDYISGRKPGRG